MKKLLLPLAVFCSVFSFGQTFNVNFGDINFGGSGVTITDKVGDGTDAGDIVLYENVITIGSQQIDAIVRTEAISSGNCINFDNPSTSGASMTNNEPRFFSPQFTFNSGGGYAQFRFEFILGGSYNNSTDSGTIITLQNSMINTYDIDGNGSSNTNQYNEFGGFDSSSLATNTRVSTSYNVNSGLTKFRSDYSANVSNVLDTRTRVKVSYLQMSEFSIRVGADNNGYAYFFIDFSPGDYWTPDVFWTPDLDLDTSTGGKNKIDTFCNKPAYFTGGGTNINTPNNTVDEITFFFNSSTIIDGSDEKFVIQGASANDTIELDFNNGASIPNVTLLGTTYSFDATVSGGVKTLRITKSSGTLTSAEAEKFIDSFAYFNNNPTTGHRIFNVTVREESFISPNTQFELLVSCSALPVNLIHYEAVASKEGNVDVKWATNSERNCSHYILQKLNDRGEWVMLSYVPGNGTTEQNSYYSYRDIGANPGDNCYRLVQYDFNGQRAFSEPLCVELNLEPGIILLYPNPSKGVVNITCALCKQDQMAIYNSDGMDVTSLIKIKNTDRGYVFDMMSLPNGIYYLNITGTEEPIVKRFTVMH
ncbi:T9SS type A sorting domain-containing protein [bacterium]|nr:T9SS type A sorting domain-containing protein [bacterium]